MSKKLELLIPDHIQEFIFSCDKSSLVALISLSAQWLIEDSDVTKEGLLTSLNSFLRATSNHPPSK
jgi:hypothetical protein